MPYVDGLPIAPSVSGLDVVAIDQGGTVGYPGTSTTRQTTVAQILNLGTGSITGPGLSVDGHLVAFNGTTGSILEDSGIASSAIVSKSGTPAIGQVAIWTNSGTVQGLAGSSNGQVLEWNGTIWTPGTVSIGGSLSITDGTHTVAGVTGLTVTGATVGGTTPNATLTISGGGTPGGSAGNIQFNNAGTFGGIGTVGTGNVVLANSPTLVSPSLGIPSAVTLTHATGLPLGAINQGGATTNQVIEWNGTAWAATTLGTGGNVSNTGTPTAGQIAFWVNAGTIQGVTSLPLTDIAQGGATTNQAITWNGTAWAPATPAGGGNVSATGTPSAKQIAVWTNATTVQGLVGNVIYPSLYGVVGDRSTDDTTALNAALAAASPGQVVTLVGLSGCLIASGNLNIPAGVSLVSGWNTPDNTLSSASSGQPTDLATLNGCIVLSSSYTINMAGASSIKGVPIYRQGLTTPAANSSAFAGTAITVNGDGCYVGYCLVLGFAQLLTSTTNTRGKFEWIYGDCNAGLSITNAYDTPYIHHCHLWPFCTYSASATLTQHQRTGYGFYLDGISSPSIAHCFAFSYQSCFFVAGTSGTGTGGAIFVDCMADGLYNGAVGFQIGTGSAPGDYVSKAVFVGCQIWANAGTTTAAGFAIDTSVAAYCEFYGCVVSTCGTAYAVYQGDVRIVGGAIDTCTIGVTVSSNNSAVVLDAVRFVAIGTGAVYNPGGGGSIYIDPSCDFTQINASGATGGVSSTMQPNVVASASPLVLTVFGEVYEITGTTGFSVISGGWAGWKITLIFSGILTVTSGSGTNAIKLTGGANFTTAVGSTLSLVHNGTQWFETGRCA